MKATVDEVRAIIERADTMADIDALENGTPLTDQGIDSLDMANIFLLIEEEYGVKISDADSQSLNSVDAIVAYLGAK